MIENRPDCWVIIKFKGDDPHYRVLGGWSESYMYGSSWRLNSGVVSVVYEDHHIIFKGSSNSVYACHKDSYGLKMSIVGVWEELKRIHGDNVELMSSDTDWFELDWVIG